MISLNILFLWETINFDYTFSIKDKVIYVVLNAGIDKNKINHTFGVLWR